MRLHRVGPAGSPRPVPGASRRASRPRPGVRAVALPAPLPGALLALPLLLPLVLLAGCGEGSDGPGDDPGASASSSGWVDVVEWYDPETQLVKKAEGRRRYGREEGTWTEYFENGRVAQQGEYLAGEKEGEWLHYRPTGEVHRRGTFRRGLEQGEFLEYHPDGSVALRLNFTDGVQDGPVRTFHPDGTLASEVPFEQGTKQGLEVQYYPGGERMREVPWVDGEAEGLSREWYPSGQLRTLGLYRDNVQVGSWLSYHEDGSYLGNREFDEAGQGVGTWTVFPPTGHAQAVQEFRDDGLVVGISWYPDGSVRSAGLVDQRARPVDRFYVWAPDGSLQESASGYYQEGVRKAALDEAGLQEAPERRAGIGPPPPRPDTLPLLPGYDARGEPLAPSEGDAGTDETTQDADGDQDSGR